MQLGWVQDSRLTRRCQWQPEASRRGLDVHFAVRFASPLADDQVNQHEARRGFLVGSDQPNQVNQHEARRGFLVGTDQPNQVNQLVAGRRFLSGCIRPSRFLAIPSRVRVAREREIPCGGRQWCWPIAAAAGAAGQARRSSGFLATRVAGCSAARAASEARRASRDRATPSVARERVAARKYDKRARRRELSAVARQARQETRQFRHASSAPSPCVVDSGVAQGGPRPGDARSARAD